MKDKAIDLIDGGLESYLLGLYGLNLPAIRTRKKAESRYAPVMGMFGASVELLVKACLVQAYGIRAMYNSDDIESRVYKFGTDCITDLKKAIKDNEQAVSFIYINNEDVDERKQKLINYLDKFKLLQGLRANGLHAGMGCSRDVAVVTANDVYGFIQLLSKGKRLKAYLKGIPAPESTIRDREAIIEDLSRRINSKNSLETNMNILRGLYIVLPYIPEIKPDWMDRFDKINVVPPKQDDLNYLMQTLQEAHSIYLLKNRGGKDGVPVRIDTNNPEALPIAIQNIKRTLNSIPDQFNNDVLTANTRLEQNRLDLPIDDFLVDLFALGLDKSNVLQPGIKMTAQQAWPFIVSAYSTQGTPRPCWQFITHCDELIKLENFLERARKIGNGYYKRRVDTVIKCINAYLSGSQVCFQNEKDPVFSEISDFVTNKTKQNPITPQFIRSNNFSEETAHILSEYISEKISAGDAIERILCHDTLQATDRKVVVILMNKCVQWEQRNGLVAVLRSNQMKTYYSLARKQMFLIDICCSGLKFSN